MKKLRKSLTIVGMALVGLLVTFFIPALFKIHEIPEAKESTSNLKIWIEQSSTEVLPFEPLGVVVYLKNELGQAQRVTESWQLFRYRYTKAGKWEIYYPENVPTQFPSPPRSVVLQPGEIQTWLTYFDFNALDKGEHVFAQPGTVQLKVSVGRIESATLSITVIDPQGEDSQAYEFLKQTKLVQYFGIEAFNRYPYDEQTVVSLEAFIQNFPDSEYREYAQLALALLWMHGVEGTVDLIKARDLLTDLSTRAGRNINAPVHYYLGLIAHKQGSLGTATQHYRSAIQRMANPYFKYLAERALQGM